MKSLDQIREQVVEIVEQSLKDLIETKHLYQSVALPIEDLTKAARMATPTGPRTPGDYGKVVAEAWENTVRLLVCGPWVVEPNVSGQKVERNVKIESGELPLLIITMPSVRMYCNKCCDREPFNVLNVSNAVDANDTLGRKSRADPVFVVNFECQGCKSGLVTIMIRRFAQQGKMMLTGRTPMESVQIPPFIPGRSVFYRKARIAAGTGFILAAAAYLRTFIEHFARSETGITERVTGETLMESYTARLPPKVRDVVPSFTRLYGDLSQSLHEGDEDPKRFNEIIAQVDQHFETRKALRHYFEVSSSDST
jgi:hypothetical protein